MKEELHLFINSLEAISDNYATLQLVKNIMLEFKILDVAFRGGYAEISLEKQVFMKGIYASIGNL